MKNNPACPSGFKLTKPKLWAPSPELFWNDEHISRGMLAAHLNPEIDAASRKPDFMDRSAHWIAAKCAPAEGKTLLDLGCGPGLYAERFHALGFQVFGVDLAPRAIAYAQAHTAREISYLCADYLNLAFSPSFNVATMIYCDFGVLPPVSRKTLLAKIWNTFTPGGALFLDVFTPEQYSDFQESENTIESPGEGFWSPGAHTVLERRIGYSEDHTYLHQVGVISEHKFKIYHIWEHVFTPSELQTELRNAGFSEVEIFGDISGTPFSPRTKTLCAIARK